MEETVNLSPSTGATKTCISCGTPFPATTEYFYANSKNRDGLLGRCKTCHNHNSANYLRNRLANEKELRKAQAELAAMKAVMADIMVMLKESLGPIEGWQVVYSLADYRLQNASHERLDILESNYIPIREVNHIDSGSNG